MMQGLKRVRLKLVLVLILFVVIVVVIITWQIHGKATLYFPAVDLGSDGLPEVTATVLSNPMNKKMNPDDPEASCPFRNSPLYRSIFVYPSPRDPLFESMKSDQAVVLNGTVPMWPWIEMNDKFRKEKFLVYSVEYQEMNHFALEQYVYDIMTHPDSCLQTNDPDTAKLFYVPHMEMLHWRGLEKLGQLPRGFVKKHMTPYGAALLAAIDGNYDRWERRYGLTSQYWKRNQGADHFFVMTEPCNGLRHLTGARGSVNYITTQRQNRPPIVISHELSATYVKMHPKCAAKNIVMPYANIDGKWFNGYFEKQAEIYRQTLVEQPQHQEEMKDENNTRPILVHYRAGGHGQCKHLRRGLNRNHRCSNSFRIIGQNNIPRTVQMHLSTFCPCPAGDSPSARRMNDAVAAGCIPVVLSTDYVWPLSKDVDPTSHIDPTSFSIRLNFSDFGRPVFDGEPNCQRLDGNVTLEEYLTTNIPQSEIHRLQGNLKRVAPLFEYYQRRRNMSDTPLSELLLPDGGAAHALVHELAKRAVDNRWIQCQEELERPSPSIPTSNPC